MTILVLLSAGCGIPMTGTVATTKQAASLSVDATWNGPTTMSLSSSSASSAPVSYTVLSGPGNVAGTTLTVTGAGVITVSAAQASTDAFNAASATKLITVVAPQLTLAPAAASFPDTQVGSTSSPISIAVTNTGDLSADLQIAGTTGFTATSSCPVEIPAHATCHVNVVFAPQNPGAFSGQINATAIGSAAVAQLSGLAMSPPRIPTLIKASLSSLQSGAANSLHLMGTNLDGVTLLKAGSSSISFTHVSPTELATSVTPPSWMDGTISFVALTPNDQSDALSLPLTAQAVSYDVAVRFAQQAAMTVTPDQIHEIQTRGLSKWIDWQLTTPMYPYESRADMVYGTYMQNMQSSQYALRSRMTLALKQIYTFGASDQCFEKECGHYWEATLQRDAFGNERNLLQDITLSRLMGNFLDNARNYMQYSWTGTYRANQNYARELMQLMTIGPLKLNHDGSTYYGPDGKTVDTYSEDNLSDMSAAMSGYGMRDLNFFAKVTDGDPLAPMILWEQAHSPLAKNPLPGIYIPANQGGAADTKAVLDALFNHTNMGPFLARRFIQHMVSSNPSPAYISRVADVFEDNGHGVRGDLAAVVRAMLLDPEARRGDDPTTAVNTDSHMLEPLLYIGNVMAALGGSFTDDRVYLITDVLGEDPFMSRTVFGPYSPDNKIPTGEFAPEMQLVSDSGYITRLSMVNSLVKGGLPGMAVDLTQSPLYNAPDVSALLEEMRHFLFHGRMPASVNNALQAYAQANPNLTPNQLLPGLCTIVLTTSSYQVVR